MNRYRIRSGFRKPPEGLLLALALLIGLAGAGLCGKPAEPTVPEHTELAAWWGGLYPQYCLPQALERREGPDGGERVKIRFKYFTFLNELGGIDE